MMKMHKLKTQENLIKIPDGPLGRLVMKVFRVCCSVGVSCS